MNYILIGIQAHTIVKENILDKQEATKKIAELIAAAQALIDEAETVADANEVGFSINVGGYGMGGYYEPCPEGADPDEEDEYYDRKYGWMPSSQSC